MKYFSAFTGVGGFELGLPEDWECVGMSEVDKYANRVIKYRFPNIRNFGDVEKIAYGEMPDFDVLVGGSPCQDLSMAGKRQGLAGSRSRLFYSYMEILRAKKPHYFIFENVAGLLSSNQGWDYAEVLSQFSENGYDLWSEVLDASWFGIPQHRERVFILGSLGRGGFRQIYIESSRNKEDNGVQRQTSNTIRREYRKNTSNGSFIIENQLNAQKEIENIHFSRRRQDRIYGTSGIAPTLLRHTGGTQRTKIAVPVRDLTGQNSHAQGRQLKTPDEPSFTLQVSSHQGVYIENQTLMVHSFKSRSGDPSKGGTGHLAKELDHSRTVDTQKSQGIEKNGRIRYLTPLECERLMGWPDDWTRWGIDEKGDKIELSDKARYNLIGNGVVPQVVSAVISDIMIVESEKK